MKLFKKAKKGFTLVELVVVIAVIAILAAVSVGAYFGVTESAKNSKADQEAKALHTAIMLVVNDPDSGWGIDKDYKITDNSTTDTTSFESKLEKMYGLELGTATYDSTNKTWTVADVESVKSSGYVKAIAAGDTTVTYVTTDKVARVINIKTGSVDKFVA